MSSETLTLPSINAHNWLKAHSHGVVWKRPDGVMARCLGPGFCELCKTELMVATMLVELGRIPNDELTDNYKLRSYAEGESKCSDQS